MKLNIKKLAAVAAGVALVGSALAPMASAISLTKSDLMSSTAVNVDVVVGKKAAVSDGVWAGNIAAAIGSKAYAEKTVAVGAADCSGGATPSVTDLTVDLSVGGTTSVTGGKAFFDYMDSTATETNFNSQTVTEASVPSLYYNGAKSYTWNGSQYTTSIQERLYFTSDVKFDREDNDDLIAEISANGLKYNLNLGTGVPAVEALGGTTTFTDDANDNVRIPFFGTDYLLKTSTPTAGSEYVELIQTSGETRYSEGDRITDLEGYDGESYYIEVGPGGTVGSTQKIQLSLYKEDGTLVKSDNFGTVDVIFYGDDTGEPILSTLVNISEILKTVVSDAEVYTPTILVGSSRIRLYHNKGYPYDATIVDADYDWKVTLGFSSDKNYLQDINISNKSKYDFIGFDALKVGDKAAFPEGLGTLEFLGLQLPDFTGVSKTERTTVIEIKAGELLYRDNTYEAQHTVPLYIYESGISNSDGSGSFVVDGKTISYAFSGTDLNVFGTSAADGSGTRYSCIGDANYLNGEPVSITDINYTQMDGALPRANNAIVAGTDVNVGQHVDINGMNYKMTGVSDSNTCIYLQADGNVTFRKGTTTGTLIQEIYYADNNYSTGDIITLAGASDITHKYEVIVEEGSSTSELWLLLDAQSKTTQYGKTWSLTGTDVQEDVSFDDYGFYLPHTSKMPLYLDGDTNYNQTEYFTANFEIDEDEDGAPVYDINAHVDTGTGNLMIFPNTQLSSSGVGAEADYNGLKQLSESSDASVPSWAYTDWGSKIVVLNHEFKVTIPENRPKAEVLISGTGTSKTVTGGEDLTIAEGETGSTTGGTRVTVTKVNYNATCEGGIGTGTGECTVTPTTYMSPLAVGQLVTYDESPSSATHIIVGGWKVNKLAEGVTLADGTPLKSALTKSGDSVAERTSDGDIIVAGYKAGDTGTAAQELINAIDNL